MSTVCPICGKEVLAFDGYILVHGVHGGDPGGDLFIPCKGSGQSCGVTAKDCCEF